MVNLMPKMEASAAAFGGPFPSMPSTPTSKLSTTAFTFLLINRNWLSVLTHLKLNLDRRCGIGDLSGGDFLPRGYVSLVHDLE